jgi:anti-sigma regulatory factor (Ser/Thr protein kinase)
MAAAGAGSKAKASESKTAGERRRGADAMLRHRILVISSEANMRRALKRLMTATGAVTEFINDLSTLPADPPSLLAVDLRSASAPKLKDLEKVFPDVRLLAIVGSQDFGQMVECLRLERCGSVITYDDGFEPEDFIITVTKLLHGQVFGLQKYFPWGVTLYNMEIASYEEKSRALDVLNAYAELAGARGPVRDRMALVAEELIMNALYHAPVDEDGKQKYEKVPRKELAKLTFDRKVKITCASNGQHFAIAVTDAWGSLDKDTVVKFLSKGTQKALEPENRESGAGLGLVTGLKNASKLVFNLSPGIGTEVIALFDLDLLAKGRAGVRSVHVFTERRKVAPAVVRAPESSTPAAGPLVVGALAIVVLIVGIVGVVKKLNEPPPPEIHAELIVPDGKTSSAPVKLGNADAQLRIERHGSKITVTTERAPAK